MSLNVLVDSLSRVEPENQAIILQLFPCELWMESEGGICYTPKTTVNCLGTEIPNRA
jgi:hypothetical protein